jgi:molybdopterin-containing oxidoreductase family membrane subunit
VSSETTTRTDRRINSDLLRPLMQTSWRFYLLVAVFGGVVATAFVAWMWQITTGFGVTGIRWPVYWGFYVTSFVFWIGISHAGTLISAILRLVNAGWRVWRGRRAAASCSRTWGRCRT